MPNLGHILFRIRSVYFIALGLTLVTLAAALLCPDQVAKLHCNAGLGPVCAGAALRQGGLMGRQSAMHASCKPTAEGGKVVLVTGSAGFIGFWAAKQLKARGDGVVGIDNFNSYYPVSLKRARAAELTAAGVLTVEGDINNEALLAHVFQVRAARLATASQACGRRAGAFSGLASGDPYCTLHSACCSRRGARAPMSPDTRSACRLDARSWTLRRRSAAPLARAPPRVFRCASRRTCYTLSPARYHIRDTSDHRRVSAGVPADARAAPRGAGGRALRQGQAAVVHRLERPRHDGALRGGRAAGPAGARQLLLLMYVRPDRSLIAPHSAAKPLMCCNWQRQR
jgi:NAD dependent epimerase/dehydratase family